MIALGPTAVQIFCEWTAETKTFIRGPHFLANAK